MIVNNKYGKEIWIILPVILALLCLWLVVAGNNQASMAIPLSINFEGEYSYDGVNWYPYSKDCDMSALKGDVTLKGHLDNELPEGALLNFLNNHIGVSISLNGELIYIDAPSEIRNYGIDLMPSMCGKRWEQVLSPNISTADEIEFTLINYHKHGNEHAYKELLSSLMIAPMDNSVLKAYLKPYTKPFEMMGYALIITATMLLGASLAAFIFRSNMFGSLFKMGAATLFTGGYIIFDIMMVYLMDELLVVKTYGKQLCLMLAIYFTGIWLCDILRGKIRKAAEWVMTGSAVINLAITVIVCMGKVLIYDTLFVWGTAQYVISSVLIFLCVAALIREKKIRVELLLFIGVNLAIILDMVGAGYYMYHSVICFKMMYVVLLIVFLLQGAKQIIIDHQASLKNKELKRDLEKSRITVMLSQIQPHFLYNSLTSVMDLCDKDPKQAKSAIADFADYLRGNLDSLKTEKSIPFARELEHIKKYLKLEKLRFGDELEVIYDIQTQDFMLPSLSVQPLVENAVKHGVGRKPGGGTVVIHTFETDEAYVIRICDNGIGFEEGEYANDGGTHIGIENIRKRLDMMITASLQIESKKGEGTEASIRIPKRRD